MFNGDTINTITLELKWLEKIIAQRVQLFQDNSDQFEVVPFDDLSHRDDLYSKIINHYEFDYLERGVFTVAFAHFFYNQIFDSVVDLKVKYPNRTQIGGFLSNQTEFSPNLELICFLFTDHSIEERVACYNLFSSNSSLFRFFVLQLNDTIEQKNIWNKTFSLNQDYIQLILTGEISKPNFSLDFPAKLLTTNSRWKDLVLTDNTLNDLNEIIAWYHNEEKIRIDWGYDKVVKPGFRTVFFGPSGTGKSLTAALLGQQLGIDVYRIDITKIVSKYIGETAKNLENLFKQAENKNWILFFDEAESLFGKRTTGGSVNDKYANQEVGYLLQRIEDYPGIVIIATNLKSQMDDAFLRRFQNYIHFPQPEQDLREKLWRNSFNNGHEGIQLDIDYKKLASQFELTGGIICNVIRTCLIQMVMNNAEVIKTDDVESAVKKELSKMGQFYSNR